MLHLMGHGRVGQIAEKHNGLERGCLVVGQITHPAGIGRPGTCPTSRRVGQVPDLPMASP